MWNCNALQKTLALLALLLLALPAGVAEETLLAVQLTERQPPRRVESPETPRDRTDEPPLPDGDAAAVEATEAEPTPRPPVPRRRNDGSVFTALLNRSRFQRSSTRLARAPDIFGDFGTGTLLIQTQDNTGGTNITTGELPLAGGSRRVKISENNRALPTNRVYMSYQHFHNALGFSRAPTLSAPPDLQKSESVDRFTLGLESTFLDDRWSWEIRMPFTADIACNISPDLVLENGNIGDLAVALKTLLIASENTAVAAGMGITVPTGSDLGGQLPTTMPPSSFRLHNQSVHLLPFLGIQMAGESPWFAHLFGQLDIATGGNQVDFVDALGNTATGKLDEQNLAHLDVALGRWLFETPDRLWTGLAGSVELHYTTTLQNSDFVAIPGAILVGNVNNRSDIVHLTAGLTAEFFGETHLRAAVVAPFDTEERLFDSEVQVILSRRY